MIELLLGIALAAAVPLGVTEVRRALGLGATVRPGAFVTGRPAIATVTAAAIVSLTLPRGPVAGVLVIPWLAFTILLASTSLIRVISVVRAANRRPDPTTLGVLASVGFLVVGASWLEIDRVGLRPFGFATTIVLLTAVHFHVAGFLLTLAGSLAAGRRPESSVSVAVLALVLGTPLTALGFFGYPAASWIGALLVAGGGIGIGLATISLGRTPDRRGEARPALVIGGATLLITMPLAIAYATGSTFGIAVLDIPAMAAVHGGLNVVGFAIPTMIGWSRTTA